MLTADLLLKLCCCFLPSRPPVACCYSCSLVSLTLTPTSLPPPSLPRSLARCQLSLPCSAPSPSASQPPPARMAALKLRARPPSALPARQTTARPGFGWPLTPAERREGWLPTDWTAACSRRHQPLAHKEEEASCPLPAPLLRPPRPTPVLHTTDTGAGRDCGRPSGLASTREATNPPGARPYDTIHPRHCIQAQRPQPTARPPPHPLPA